MNAMDKARGDPRVQNVLRELSGKVKIKYAASKHEGWGSNLQNGQATIWWSGCRHPSASLMHELLHIRLQLRGYRRIRVSVSNIADPETAKRLWIASTMRSIKRTSMSAKESAARVERSSVPAAAVSERVRKAPPLVSASGVFQVEHVLSKLITQPDHLEVGATRLYITPGTGFRCH
jgi:hypothetical protein